MAVGFFLGAMVPRHDEPIVVIHNATEETLLRLSIVTDFAKNPRGIPEAATYALDKLQPHHTWTERLSSHRSTVFDVRATTAGGNELSSEKVSVESKGVLFALVSSGRIRPQYERLMFR